MSDSWRLPGTFFRYLDVPGLPVTPHGYHVYHDSAISRIYPGYSPILWSRVLCQVPLFLVTVASAIKPGVLENSPCISIDRSFYLDHMPFLADLPAMFGDSSNRSIPILLDASPMAIEFGCSASAPLAGALAGCRTPATESSSVASPAVHGISLEKNRGDLPSNMEICDGKCGYITHNSWCIYIYIGIYNG